jgi:Protein of unknown function (DUF2442)
MNSFYTDFRSTTSPSPTHTNQLIAVSPWHTYTLWVCFSFGQTYLVNLQGLIRQDEHFALLEDSAELSKVNISPEGDAVEWAAGMVLGAELILLPNGHTAKPFETTLIGEGALHAHLLPHQEHPNIAIALAGMLRNTQEEYGVRNEWYPNLIYDLYQLSQSDFWANRQYEYMNKIVMPVMRQVGSLGRIPSDLSKDTKYLCQLYVGMPSGDWFLVDDIKVKAPAQAYLTDQGIGYLKREAVETLEIRLKRQNCAYNFIAFKGYSPMGTGTDLL